MDFSDLEPLLYQKSMQIVRSVLGIHKKSLPDKVEEPASVDKSARFYRALCRYQPVINGVRDHRFGLICSMTGLDKYFFKKGCNFCGIVAEKTKNWSCLGRLDAILSTVVKKAHIESLYPPHQPQRCEPYE